MADSLETREAFFLEKIRVARERKGESVEGAAMAMEDILSSLPPLTVCCGLVIVSITGVYI